MQFSDLSYASRGQLYFSNILQNPSFSLHLHQQNFMSFFLFLFYFFQGYSILLFLQSLLPNISFLQLFSLQHTCNSALNYNWHEFQDPQLGPYLLQDKALTLLSPVERTHTKLLRNCGPSHLSAFLPSYSLCCFPILFLSSPFLPLLEVFHVALT